MFKNSRAAGTLAFAVALLSRTLWSGATQAEPLKVLTAGAFKEVLLAVIPAFEASGLQLQWQNDTVGNLVKRIEGGERFDVVIASPSALRTLENSGKISGGTTNLASVGVGVAIREGAPKPDIATVEAFKQALLTARSVAYIDPASGGSSGIYLAGLLEKLGIGAEVKAKSVLVRGGYVAERVASGEAEIALHQISEILPVKGVVLVGPLPREIQNFTVYSAGIAAAGTQKASAHALIDLIRSGEGAAAIKTRGLEPVQ